MYPYQHTPMGNPYISRIVRGIYGWKNPQESQTRTPAITTMGAQGNHRQQLVAERSQLPRRDKPLRGFLGEEVQHFPARPWYVRHINLVPFETYQKGQLNPNWLILIAFGVSLSKQKLSKKKRPKLPPTLVFLNKKSNIFWRLKNLPSLVAGTLRVAHQIFAQQEEHLLRSLVVWFWKKKTFRPKSKFGVLIDIIMYIIFILYIYLDICYIEWW